MNHPGHPAPSDSELISRCRSGDAAAWSAFVERYGRLVYSVPHRLGLSDDACEDVFQEVFATVLKKLGSLRDVQSLPKWLLTVAYHASCRQHRAKDRGSPSSTPADATPPEEDLIRWERQALVRTALEKLGGSCERLLNALFLESESPSYQDIARKLGMPVGSIGPTRNRCLQKLLEIVRSMAPEESSQEFR